MWQKIMKRESARNCSFLTFTSWVRTGTYWGWLEDLGKCAKWTLALSRQRFVIEDFLSIFCSQGASHV
jgi:hypothetical protein